jgi:hypothetical protein
MKLLLQLLILTQGRYLTGEDYERIVTVFPGKPSKNQLTLSTTRFHTTSSTPSHPYTILFINTIYLPFTLPPPHSNPT